jgi:superfamily II DNA or RNA helicase
MNGPVRIFEVTDINKSFTKTILVRGADYVRKRSVLDAWYSVDGDLCGKVRSSSGGSYRVVISPVRRAQFIELESECSCPYFSQCKHAAALALYALNHDVRVESTTMKPEVAIEKLPVIPEVALVPTELPLPAELKSWLGSIEGATKPKEQVDLSRAAKVYYELSCKPTSGGSDVPVVLPVTRNILKSGNLGARHEIKSGQISSYNRPKEWLDVDFDLINDLNANAARFDANKSEFKLDGKHGVRILQELIETQRCTWNEITTLRLGKPRQGQLTWETSGPNGLPKPKIKFEGVGRALATSPPWYVDYHSAECGPLECGIKDELASLFIKGGYVAPEYLPAVREKLVALGFSGDALPNETAAPIVRATPPVPCFVVEFESCEKRPDYWNPQRVTAPLAFGKLTFEYEGRLANAEGADIRWKEGDQIYIIRRNQQAERLAREFLEKCGWGETRFSSWEIPKARGNQLCIDPPDSDRLLDPLERVQKFAENVVPKLISSGWKIEIDQTYRFVEDSDVEWNVGVEGGSGIDWFELQLGIQVEGKPYDLKPVLISLFKELSSGGHSITSVARTQKSDDLFVFGDGGQVIRLSRQRLSAMLEPLVEIFGGAGDWPEEFRLSKAMFAEAEKFKDAIGTLGVPWKSTEELANLGEKFSAFDHLEPLNEPDGFIGELRPYQKEGLAWLQFLREFKFGGVLADDMGLGKTVQVLAHIQLEKRSGRMDRPCLIVAPTSTMPNWRRECERFVPELSVVTLQGAGRSGRFSELKDVDIALTTYPLLARDKGALLGANYHIIVLDEAQNIKNPATGAAKAARELKGRHKLCLSGTPIENHLGELWSLFHFLMPGFLGSDPEFKKDFRGPIEKYSDAVARERLSRRVKPFMLRRTKGQVVKELPPKTEIIESIAFDDPQRDLYESIRLTMDEQVRNLIAAQGFDRSRIQILDALLKLRQVCCDPRLVKLAAAKSVTSSAKLDRLLDMLTVLLEDGRKVLLFSQFTSMLNLIEERLRAANMKWVRISGDTTDRDTPVRQFQAGEVPLFLISLKAGGTGLNLTAADTVILYDPWWNPAVENQAIDRAHRIGQDKAVIVYKLVAAGTIEEKMLEMQARKGDIARSILTDDAEGIRTLTADDLRWVLSKD